MKKYTRSEIQKGFENLGKLLKENQVLKSQLSKLLKNHLNHTKKNAQALKRLKDESTEYKPQNLIDYMEQQSPENIIENDEEKTVKQN